MCLAVPGQIVEVTGDDPVVRMARVSFGGAVKEISLAYTPEAKPGDYVLAHVGFALQTIDEEEAQKTLELLRQLAEHRINAIVLTGYPEKELREEAEDKYKTFAFIDKSALAENVQRLREVVQEAFNLLELKEKAKMRAIQAASALQTVTFPEELSSWPLRKYRKDK